MTGESYGRCCFCMERVTRRGASQHLRRCSARKRLEDELGGEAFEGDEVEVFHLVVEPRWGAELYWLHVAVRGDASLDALDQFLRDIWLECCGHLSQFRIHGSYFDSGGFDSWSGGPGMEVDVERVLEPKLKFDYIYDMGDSTDLKLRVVGVSMRSDAFEDVTLLARNEAPAICCSLCGNPARWVCTECQHRDEGWLCEDCADGHECGTEMLLPFVNSPRVGICGYCGPKEENEET
mgnify:CR=1 FL=1